MDFWSNALPLMYKKGVRQTDLANITGKSSASVSDWVNKRITPRADDALKIAELLGVSVNYLLTGEYEDNELSPREKELLSVCSILKEDKFDIVLQTARLMRKDMEQELSGGSSSAGLEAE